MAVASASKLVRTGAMSGKDVRRAREEGLRRNAARQESVQRESNRVEQVFRVFDKNGDGCLTTGEFAEALRQMNPTLSDNEVRTYARLVDHDRNGVVEWKEFAGKLTAAADTMGTVPRFLKGKRWQDSGDFIAHEPKGDPHNLATTTHADFPRVSPAEGARLPVAGQRSTDQRTQSRDALLMEEWASLELGSRRGRGVRDIQSRGLRFDPRGFQAGTPGRKAWEDTLAPAPRPPTRAHLADRHRGSVQECLQPALFPPGPRDARKRATKALCLHLKVRCRCCARGGGSSGWPSRVTLPFPFSN